MLWIQILLLCFFGFASGKAIVRYRAGDMGFSGVLFWLVFWMAGAVVVIWPNATFYFANILGIGRGADLIVYAGLALVFFLVFRLMATVERQKKEITELARRIALGDTKNN